MFQTLGINNPTYNSLRRGFATGIAGLILVGNLSFPIAVQAGLIDEDNRSVEVGGFDKLDSDNHGEEG